MILDLSRTTLLLSCASIAFPALAESTALADVNEAATVTSDASSDDGDQRLPNIVVTGDVLYANQMNATRTPTPIIDVPQSLSITTADQIVRQGFDSVGDIVLYTPGVTNSQGEGHRDSVVFRGVRSTADFFVDGVRDDVEYYRGLYNLEQVEILRGPNALLFGRGGTGGILNRVAKKGVVGETFTGVRASVDTFGAFDIWADLNLATSGSSALRVNAAYESLKNHRDLYDGEQISVNPTFRAELGTATTIDLSYEYLNHERFIDRGIPTDDNGDPVRALRRITFADPQNNYATFEAHVLRGTLQHNFSDNLKANFTASWGDYDKTYANYFPVGYNPATNVVAMDGYIDNGQRQNLVMSGNLIGEFDTGEIGHTLILGAEFIDTSNNNDRLNAVFDTAVSDGRRADVEFFNATRPLAMRGGVGTLADGRTTRFGFTSLNDDTEADLTVISAYIQDEVKVADWLRLVLGARFDSFEITVLDNRTGTVRTRKDEEITPRLGLILKPQENLSLYTSYSETFLPRSGDQFADINPPNDALDPDTFSNLEAGVKWDIRPGLALTAAAFQIEQSSPQPADNNPDTLDVIDSKIRGFEAQLQGQVTPGWFLSAGYSYLDGEQQSRTGPTGRRVRELPEHMFSIWNNFQATDRLGIGIGLTAQDETFADNGNTATLPAYARVDLAVSYQLNDSLRLQVNVENLFDELYFPNAHSADELTVAPPLNARFTIVGRF
ncbi:TonB-dependent siderophore receptor [Porphyrobacter sp. HT-58-2]|uniref:TonB-dependent receptor n=1 Tax=Porphyrobacter sp. HT-58-2 TaxID=2023229 RepID=UPI000CDCBDE2|nr:TonB-dependent siderophore receptor [Porphyrobacter sp. HT-58-2]AUX70670.1 TonB-dependent siderophore receptor [Porphyrobacter sp. HT-58-2]